MVKKVEVNLSGVEGKYKTLMQTVMEKSKARHKDNIKVSNELFKLEKDAVLALIKEKKCFSCSTSTKVGDTGFRNVSSYLFVTGRKGNTVQVEEFVLFTSIENGKVINAECRVMRSEKLISQVFSDRICAEEKFIFFLSEEDGKANIKDLVEERILGCITGANPKVDLRAVMRRAKEISKKKDIAKREKSMKIRQKAAIKRIARKAIEGL